MVAVTTDYAYAEMQHIYDISCIVVVIRLHSQCYFCVVDYQDASVYTSAEHQNDTSRYNDEVQAAIAVLMQDEAGNYCLRLQASHLTYMLRFFRYSIWCFVDTC